MTSLLSRLRVHHVFTTLVAVELAAGCAAGTSQDASGGVVAPDSGLGKVTVIKFDAGKQDSASATSSTVNPLCGTANYCGKDKTPDDNDACADYDGGGPTGFPRRDGGPRHTQGDAGARDAGPSRDAGLDTGAGREGGADRDARAGMSDHDAADGDVRYEALPVPAPLPPPADAGPHFACQIGRDGVGGPTRECVVAGVGAKGAPCGSVKDCGPGLACVGARQTATGQGSATGLCFQYCCEEPCPAGTYCTERPLLDGMPKMLNVPVCAPGVQCGLLDPFPCTAPTCACPADTACTVVGDGTEGCVKPGTGKVGDSCGACAAGYYCSLATSTCVKICKTDRIDMRCAPGKCQATAGFPAGFGLCVGYPPTVQ